MTGREVHLMVRGDVNPLLARIAAHGWRTSRSPRPTWRTCSCACTAATSPARTPTRRCRHDRLPPRAPAQPDAHRSGSPSPSPATARSWALMYPIMKSKRRADRRQYMDTFPKEFLAAFGMTGVAVRSRASSSPPTSRAGCGRSWRPRPALLLGTRAVAADLDRGFLDLPLATPALAGPLPRRPSIAAQVVVMAVLAAAAVGGPVADRAAGRRGESSTSGGSPLAGVLSFAFGCAIAGPTTLLVGADAQPRARVGDRRRACSSRCTLVFVVTQIVHGLGVDRAGLRLGPLPHDGAHRRRRGPGWRPRAVRGHRARRLAGGRLGVPAAGPRGVSGVRTMPPTLGGGILRAAGSEPRRGNWRVRERASDDGEDLVAVLVRPWRGPCP